MNIIVFIKQVPDSDDVKLDENGNLIRSGVGAMINPVDKNALELGLSLRDRFGGRVTAVTMGPPRSQPAMSFPRLRRSSAALILLFSATRPPTQRLPRQAR